ncbi:MAG: 4Fe-4S dicluster domain-containing protein, partial [Candidatus Omnitrophica bacterium]|nr:4Fe-4S dicluster domain-containing protein [Candidatus Omnitrophota bacterium]
ILAMDGEGPSGGRIRNLGLIVIGQDAVSVDTILARIANIDVNEISTITEVNKLGIGESNLEAIEIRGENLKAITVKDFKLPSSSILARLPKPIVKNVARLITFKPYINKKQCTRCNICVRSCPVNTIKEKNNYLQINYSGCINCMCCFEVCAFGAVEIKRSFLVKIFSIMEYRRDYES